MVVQTKHVLPPVGAIFIPRNYFELDCKYWPGKGTR